VSALKPIADELSLLLEGADNIEDVGRILWQWAAGRGGFVRNGNGSSDNVWIGPDVVVKVPYRVAPLEEVPAQYRPEELTVHEFPGPSYATNRLNRVVVQPRYRTVETAEDADRIPSDQVASENPGVLWDARSEANWGLRPDGTPVLFDF
jgi:hypothetical protein